MMKYNNSEVKPQKKLLYEVSIIRPIVITLLVLLHSFQKISNGGGMHNDYDLSITYKWIEWLVSGFRIETIALIAGYVFSYQSHNLQRSYKFCAFAWKKFKRLIIPMIVFGAVYYFCFYFHADSFTVKHFLIKLFSGCGHLWFLPMLFWCFLVIWVIDHFRISSWWLLLLLGVISVIPTPNLPLGFARLSHFVFYVYGGYFLWLKHDWLLKHWLTWIWIAFFWLLYIILVIICHTMLPVISSSNSFVEKFLILLGNNAYSLIMAVVGILALYLTVYKFTNNEGFKPKLWVISASDNCYGVYVYHQFILVWLYFFTPIVVKFNPLIVPWTGFIIAMFISLLLTKLSLKTNIGRSLIG